MIQTPHFNKKSNWGQFGNGFVGTEHFAKTDFQIDFAQVKRLAGFE